MADGPPDPHGGLLQAIIKNLSGGKIIFERMAPMRYERHHPRT